MSAQTSSGSALNEQSFSPGLLNDLPRMLPILASVESNVAYMCNSLPKNVAGFLWPRNC